MTPWFDKYSAAVSLSASDKLLVVQNDVSKTMTLNLLQAFIEGNISERVYGYLATANDTVMTTADIWYVLKGTFTNSILEGFTAGANGITYTGSGGKFECEWSTCGYVDDATVFKIALVKNGTFNEVTGALEVGAMLPGSGGGAESGAVQSEQFVSPRSLWAGELETGDVLTLVCRCTDAGVTYTPEGVAASIHRFF